ncbi:hypothetical protein INR49_026902 [Caranx melampygus]|nr:hypothetical protein INR49_026902 [Caranx melampygus]
MSVVSPALEMQQRERERDGSGQTGDTPSGKNHFRRKKKICSTTVVLFPLSPSTKWTLELSDESHHRRHLTQSSYLKGLIGDHWTFIGSYHLIEQVRGRCGAVQEGVVDG